MDSFRIDTCLLREREFLKDSESFTYIDKHGNQQILAVPASGLAFTWCQVPFVYMLGERVAAQYRSILFADGTEQQLDGLVLSPEMSDEIFKHTGKINQHHLELEQ